MNLFFKIFLWFLAAIALMIGIVFFINWTVQTEPVVSRWQVSVRNQMNIYADTAGQIYDSEGEDGLRQFLRRIRDAETVSEVDLIDQDGQLWLGEGATAGNYTDLVQRAFASGSVELDTSQQTQQQTTALAARPITFANGKSYAFVIRWDRPRPIALFGESQLRYLRLAGLLLTALLVCYALARYLSSPIGKIRQATQQLAEGNLRTRVADRIGRRHDELAALARDFDLMAERIESLVTSQQRLLRDISHELRSPLARMNVALGIGKQKASPEVAPQFERIESEADRLNVMIGRLLTLSKLESGAQDYEKEPVDLVEIVASVVDDADFEARPLGKSVNMNGDGSCIVEGNEALLRSAVENILRNAVRYTKEGTTIDVSVEHVGDKVKVAVLDHGGGVPESELKNLFKPFYRIGEARERSTGGIGLGLAIADRAIAAHEGTLTAKNTSDGLNVEIGLRCYNGNSVKNN
ncbi:MAG TPA: ATP-binding protein [Pyrinomonadaceae bacterium]|nr:ATP-binding protein [Pyrinomonadaceae bacterium]